MADRDESIHPGRPSRADTLQPRIGRARTYPGKRSQTCQSGRRTRCIGSGERDERSQVRRVEAGTCDERSQSPPRVWGCDERSPVRPPRGGRMRRTKPITPAGEPEGQKDGTNPIGRFCGASLLAIECYPMTRCASARWSNRIGAEGRGRASTGKIRHGRGPGRWVAPTLQSSEPGSPAQLLRSPTPCGSRA